MVFQNDILAGASSAEEAYEIDESCRFNSADSAYLTQTPGGAASSARLGTLSVWVKRSILGTQQALIHQQRTSDAYDALHIVFKTDNTLQFAIEGASAATVIKRITTQVFRDPSAWYHFVFAWDSNQTDDTSCAIYVNGEAITDFGTKTNPGSAQDLQWLNTSKAVWVGRSSSGSNLCDLYTSQWAVIDGSKLAASSFGKTSLTTGQWIPKDITNLTYGNEGWLFAFQDSSALGDDTSGNGNDFTSSGLAAADQVVDTPTDNYCTLNPVRPNASGVTYSEGNLRIISDSASFVAYQATFQIPATGKWYCEIVAYGGDAPISGTANWDGSVGVGGPNIAAPLINRTDNWSWGDARTTSGGTKYHDGQTTLVPASSLTDGSVVMMAVDMDNSKIWWGVDGSWMGTDTGDNDGNPATGANPAFANLSGDLFPGGACQVDPQYWNFGQLGFAHTPPTGFVGLYWSQLDDPTIADPSAYFQPTIYTGDGAVSLAVNQDGNSTFSPALVWIKNRDATDKHVWFDTVRGVTESLSCDNTDVEETNADTLTAFDSDGFTVGADVLVNTNTEKYASWQWLADESWSSGATGTRIASSGVRNTTMGFSIASWTHQTSANYNIAHGLSSRPGFFITKCLEQETNWGSWHQDQTDVAKRLILNTTSAETTAYWSDPTDNTDITSGEYPVTTTLFGFQHDTFNDTHPIIAYFFEEVEGFSKFGSYIGNGNADGPFAWCGFRPAYFLFKRTDSTDNWRVYDNQRGPSNEDDARLEVNQTSVEASGDGEGVDFLSNGVKLRSADSGWNADGGTYVFAAFADTPFKTANAR